MTDTIDAVMFPHTPPAARRRKAKPFAFAAASVPAKQGDLFTIGAGSPLAGVYRTIGASIEAPPRCRLEPDALYEAVEKLRSRGVKVFRISATQHNAAGRIVTTRQLIGLANAS